MSAHLHLGVGADECPECVELHRISAYICGLCLSGAGGECHTPGCSFFIRDAPTGDDLSWWRSQVEYFSEPL